MKKAATPLLAASAALASLLTSANSASAIVSTFTEMDSFGPQLTPFMIEDAMEIPQIDPTMVDDDAILSQVKKTLTSSLTGTVTITNQTDIPAVVSSLSVIGQVQVLDGDHTLISSSNAPLITVSEIFLPGETSIFEVNGSDTLMEIIDEATNPPADFAPWIGNGSVFKNVFADAFQNFSGSANLSIIFNTEAQADFEVVYSVHNPDDRQPEPAVPEPGTIVGLGLLGLVGVTRRVIAGDKP